MFVYTTYCVSTNSLYTHHNVCLHTLYILFRPYTNFHHVLYTRYIVCIHTLLSVYKHNKLFVYKHKTFVYTHFCVSTMRVYTAFGLSVPFSCVCTIVPLQKKVVCIQTICIVCIHAICMFVYKHRVVCIQTV